MHDNDLDLKNFKRNNNEARIPLTWSSNSPPLTTSCQPKRSLPTWKQLTRPQPTPTWTESPAPTPPAPPPAAISPPTDDAQSHPHRVHAKQSSANSSREMPAPP